MQMANLRQGFGAASNGSFRYLRHLLAGSASPRDVGPSRSLRTLRVATTALLVAAAGWVAAGLLWQIAVPPQGADPLATLAPGAAPGRSLDRTTAAQPQLAFFGVAEAPEAPLPQSAGPYVLSGVFLSSDPSASRAIVRIGDVDQIFATGGRLPNGETVEAIEGSRIILNTPAGRQTLALPTPDLSPAPEVDAPAVRPARPVEAPVANVPVQATPTVNRSQISDRQAVLAMAGNIKASIVTADGGVTGLRLDDIAGVELLNSVGLRNGDVITAVNGVPIRDTASLAKVAESLNGSPSATIVVLRNGAVTRKTVNIAD